MSDEDTRSLAQWATEGLQPDPAPAPEPVEAPAPEPVAETPAEEAPVAEAVEATEGEAEPEATPEPAKPAKGKAKPLEPWVKDRIAEVTAQRRAAEAKLAEAEARAKVLEAEAAALRKRASAPAAEGDAPTNIEPLPTPGRDGYVPASEVENRAKQIASERAMNARADQTYYAGKAAYDDFEDAIAPLKEMGAFARPDFYEALFETDAPHDVLHHLGSNPNEASKIVGLLKSGNLVKATVELAKVDARLAATKAAAKQARPVSKAPAPIKPVGGSAVPASVPFDKMDDDAFTGEFDKLARSKGWY